MHRRDFLRAAGWSGAALLSGGALSRLAEAAPQTPANQKPKRPPNFVIIFTDDQGYGDLSVYGSPTLNTPNWERMAREGAKFSDFYVAQGICTPSRAALLTGCYPRRIGLERGVLFPNDARGLNPAEITIADLLKTRGYATSCVGKWHLGDHPDFLPTRQGFDSYFGIPYSNDMGANAKNPERPPLPLMQGDKVIEAPVAQDTLTRRYTEESVRFIRDHLMTGKTHFYPQRAALGFEEMRLYDTQHLDANFESDYHIWLHEKSGGLVRDTAREIEGNSWLACPWTHSESLHPTTWNVDMSIELLSRRDPTRPFFLMAGFHRPHPPLDPPLSFYERFADKPLPPAPIGDWASENDFPITNVNGGAGRLPPPVFERTRRAYYAQIAHIDYQIGRLLFWMQRRDLLKNTWIVFSSDHGELLGDHHQWRKFNALEGSAKVPLLIKPPPGTDFARGSRCDAPVALYDLMPTLLEAAQIPIPDSVEGRSLAPLVRGESPTWREWVHGEHTRSKAGWHFVTDGREKFIWDSQSGREWFFDLQSDPQECRDLSAASESAARVTLWRSRLVEVLAARPQDGLSDGDNLLPGRIAPTVRPQLLEAV